VCIVVVAVVVIVVVVVVVVVPAEIACSIFSSSGDSDRKTSKQSERVHEEALLCL
jgi:flagellar basal body-associated protein FliL